MLVVLVCSVVVVSLWQSADGPRLEAPPPPSAAAGEAQSLDRDPLEPRALTGTGTLAAVAAPGEQTPGGLATLFMVEVERGLGIDRQAFAGAVEETLFDPRSWATQVGFDLERVDSGLVDFSVVLASPATADQLCAPLETRGSYSCFMDDKAVLNASRWTHGAKAYGPHIDRYRHYLINHEVGHGFGYGHVQCTTPGELAPVMVQQTKGVEGCRPNPWPLPEEL